MPSISAESLPTSSRNGAFMEPCRQLANEALSQESLEDVADAIRTAGGWTTGVTYTQSFTSNGGKVYGPNFVAHYVHQIVLDRVKAAFPDLPDAKAHNRRGFGYIRIEG